MIKFSEWYVGIDCGVTKDPSAICVLGRCAPLPDDDNDVGPVLEIADLARAKAIPFTQVAAEVKRVVSILDGTVTVGLDSTGPGEGLAQELRRQGVRCVAFKMGGAGHRVVRRRDTWSVPSAHIYQCVYQLLVQRRLRMSPEHALTTTLVQEMDACEVSYTPQGNVKYEVPRSGGSHGDLLVALGIAALLHEAPWSSQITAMARKYGPDRVHERRPGNRHFRGDTARQVVEDRLSESEREAQEYMRQERARFEAAGWSCNE